MGLLKFLAEILVNSLKGYFNFMTVMVSGQAGIRAPLAYVVLLAVQLLVGVHLGLHPLSAAFCAWLLSFFDFYTAMGVAFLTITEKPMDSKAFLFRALVITFIGSVLVTLGVFGPAAWLISTSMATVKLQFLVSISSSIIAITAAMTLLILERYLDAEKHAR